MIGMCLKINKCVKNWLFFCLFGSGWSDMPAESNKVFTEFLTCGAQNVYHYWTCTSEIRIFTNKDNLLNRNTDISTH